MSRQRRFGALVDSDGASFGLWAPTSKSVELQIGQTRLPMRDQEGGWRSARVAGAKPGDRYQYLIDGETAIPDPASSFQPDGVFAPSEIVDHSAYQWHDGSWRGRPWCDAVIWEAHVGTATPEGTYRALAEKLPHLKRTGITAIELMPLAECPGTRNWGYDGVLPFSPTHNYGRPDELKAFVDAAHQAGIMVILDIVFNHFGPSGNFLNLYAKAFFTEHHQTPWGAGINFDANGSSFVRDFFEQCALSWICDYHLDGLRFDAAHAILDDSDEHILASLAASIRKAAAGREVHLILENEHNQSSWLERTPQGQPRMFTAQWNDDFHHCWHVLMTGETEGYYENFKDRPQDMLARSLLEGFVFQGQITTGGTLRGEPSGHLPPEAFISFLQNHDQIGNRAFGERLATLADPHQLDIARAVLLLCPQVPMLFMGDEWGSQTPFIYFVDFSNDPSLAKAVRDGRRREFSAFKVFREDASTATIPDPTDISSFERSKLSWDELDTANHSRILHETKKLLQLRELHVKRLCQSPWHGATRNSDCPLDVSWKFGGGSLRLCLNVSDQTFTRHLRSSERVFYQSANCEMNEHMVILNPWSCLFATELT